MKTIRNRKFFRDKYTSFHKHYLLSIPLQQNMCDYCVDITVPNLFKTISSDYLDQMLLRHLKACIDWTVKVFVVLNNTFQCINTKFCGLLALKPKLVIIKY